MDDHTAAFAVLATWYAAHSKIRRLWAIDEGQRVRVIVMLEPTHDGDDIYPAWVAQGLQWAHDLQSRMDGPVELEVIDEPFFADVVTGLDGSVVAQLFWRDSSMPPD